MPQIARQSGGVIGYYPSKTDAMNDTNILTTGFSKTIGEILDDSIGNYTQWKIYQYYSPPWDNPNIYYPLNPNTIYTNGQTLPEYGGNGTDGANFLRYILYAANECCTDSTQAIGLPYDVRNDIRVGTIITQMPPPRFSSYSAYYQMRMAKSARK